MKIINSFLILLCFTITSYAQPRGWAPFEFTYKTASPAAMCGSWSEEVQAAYDIIVRNDNPVAVKHALDFFKEYEPKSPEAVDALMMLAFFEHIDQSVIDEYGFHLRYDDDYEYLSNLLPYTGDYPALTFNILSRFLIDDLLLTTYNLEGERIYPNIYRIESYKDYFCELKYRGCQDYSYILDIDCAQ